MENLINFWSFILSDDYNSDWILIYHRQSNVSSQGDAAGCFERFRCEEINMRKRLYGFSAFLKIDEQKIGVCKMSLLYLSSMTSVNDGGESWPLSGLVS